MSDDFIRTSAEIHELAAALSRAQAVMRHPAKRKHARVPTKAGGTYEYDYADLADVIDAYREPFASHGLALIQVPFTTSDGNAGVVTRVLHASGQWIEGTLILPVADSRPQTLGSVITYARRYSAAPMAGCASEDDDDANVAQDTGATIGRKTTGKPAVAIVATKATAAVATTKAATKTPAKYIGSPEQVAIVDGILVRDDVRADLRPAIHARLRGRLSTEIATVIREVCDEDAKVRGDA